jgi:ankyrin repeat protein
MNDEANIKRLQEKFSDLINYSADDITAPIDPLIYLSPEQDNCLHLAAIRGDIEAATILLDMGLDINAQGDLGSTALHYAIRHGRRPVAEMLMQRGAAQDVADEFGQSAAALLASRRI